MSRISVKGCNLKRMLWLVIVNNRYLNKDLLDEIINQKTTIASLTADLHSKETLIQSLEKTIQEKDVQDE